MAKATTIQARIDEDTKVRAQSILNALHISMSEAISMYLRQIVFHGGIPFEVKIPNELTAKVLADAEAGKGLHEAGSVDELFKELDR
jgi:DNA-damage-inducible protein J